MSKTILACLLLFHCGLARAQLPAPTTPRQDDPCSRGAAACREALERKQEEVRALQARLKELDGRDADPSKKAERAKTARTLKKSEADLARLQQRSREAKKRGERPAADAPPAASPSPVAAPPNNEDLLRDLLSMIDKPETHVAEREERGGNVQFVKDLSVGVLKVEYDKDVSAGRHFRLTATITPRNVIEDDILKELPHAPITFHLQPQYDPQRSAAAYNPAQSSGEELREFTPGEPMTWVWDVTPPAGFVSDKADLIMRARFTVADKHSGWREVSRSEIEFKETSIGGWVYANLTALLGLLAAVLTLGGGAFSYTAARRGRKVKELNRKFQRQRAMARAQAGELSGLRRDYAELRSEYDELKGRWERFLWVRRNYR